MAEPPSSPGAVHAKSSFASPAETSRPVGASGGLAVTVTSTESMLKSEGYLGSVLVATCVTVDTPALTPVTVIVLAVSQSPGWIVTAALTVALSVAPLVGVTVTSAVGFESSATV